MTVSGSAAPTGAREVRRAAPALQKIQEPIRDQLDSVTAEMLDAVSSDAPLVARMSGHLMGMRGKMIRPTLLLLSSAVDDTSEPRAVKLAAAVELVHLATLVHDDAVDHSVLRRGMPTLNSLFTHQIAVIMGDFLYSIALARLVEVGDMDALRVLVRASTEMTVGEMRQLGVSEQLSFGEEDYYALIRSKTASLMSAACEIGALAGAERHADALARYGASLGMAFQIVDDLIDYTEASTTTGKPAGQDLREHKATLPLIAAMREMPRSARREVEALFSASEPPEGAVTAVIELTAAHGGLEYARARCAEFAAQAEGALDTLPETVARTALIDSISYVMERHS
jgi:octaprenyl-diphosphate synthase